MVIDGMRGGTGDWLHAAGKLATAAVSGQRRITLTAA